MASPDNDVVFDRIMEMVGDDGPFQKRYNLIYNVLAVLIFGMTVVNILLVLTVPDHNCSVPGREVYNVTSEDHWKNLTLPRELNSRGESSYSSCRMYNLSKYSQETTPVDEWVFQPNETTSCLYGYEYDRAYFDRTPVTEQDWVCEKELHPTNVFAFIRFGEVSGTFILGQLGDRIGRLPVYLISLAMGALGRALAIFTAPYYGLFALLAFVGSFASNTGFQSPLIVAMEISKDENRASLSMWQLGGWTVGICVAPMILWWCRDWVWLLLGTSLPLLVFYCLPQYNIESPRWLAGQGRYPECIRMLRKIAKVNGKRFDMTVEELREKAPQKESEKMYGIVSLFSGSHMAKLTSLLLVGWICNTIPTFTLLLIATQMGGNPFMNFFWQGAVELPAYLCGQVLCDRIGRRWTNSAAFLCNALCCIPVIFIIHHPGTELYTSIFAVVIKFFVCVTYFALYLQSFEVYPTLLRQTGTSFGIIVANIFGALGPYIVFLGTSFDIRLPFVVLMLIGMLGFVTSIFLPETLYQKLPDTMDDGRRFGKNQRFWTMPKRPRAERPQNLGEVEKLNQS